ncbi:MAG TPA: (2Fe-2S)-binding protein [Acidimicrobiales bacterium]|nr:(2Fe-2S)-binding protein [Acidimicrobiales bacterium]|tara:strand:+ start:934 stop:1422 length:489 start_codon:yes stop_codon:yes gene_type:complete
MSNIFYTLNVNGEDHQVADAWAGESLLWVLRERLGFPGAKNACEEGECGSCSVQIGEEVVCSCLVLAGSAIDQEITTIEGLSPEGELGDVQQAFIDAGAVQCGFCTPGLLVTIGHLLEKNENPDDLTVREAISGNLCRCTGYGRILEAVQMAAASRRGEKRE